MFTKNKRNQIAIGILAPLMFASSAASAADLPCVQRAIDRINVNGQVLFSAVSLHPTGVAGYLAGKLTNKKCGGPWGIGLFDCLTSGPDYSNALLSNRVHYEPGSSGTLFGAPGQPFAIQSPLPLLIKLIPPDSSGVVTLQQANATYDFHPQCVGDLLTGNDQWGNHWTISFQLLAAF
jgi:hypothetical protein